MDVAADRDPGDFSRVELAVQDVTKSLCAEIRANTRMLLLTSLATTLTLASLLLARI